MVGSFRVLRESSPEPFAKIKTAKFLSSACKANRVLIHPAWNYLVANRNASVRVPLTAIAEAIQEIEVLR